MFQLADLQYLDAGANGKNVPPVFEVEAASRCTRETHLKKSDIDNKETINNGNKLSDWQCLVAFKNGNKYSSRYSSGDKGTSVNAFLFCINPVDNLTLKCSDCQGYLHYKCFNYASVYALHYSKTNHKYTCKRAQTTIAKCKKNVLKVFWKQNTMK